MSKISKCKQCDFKYYDYAFMAQHVARMHAPNQTDNFSDMQADKKRQLKPAAEQALELVKPVLDAQVASDQTGDWLDSVITPGMDSEERRQAKATIQSKLAEQELWAYQNGESSANADWSFALSEFADIEVDGPMELVAKLKEIEQRHVEEVRAARVDEVSKALQAGSIRTIPTKEGNVVEWWPNGLNMVLNYRLQHLTSQESKE